MFEKDELALMHKAISELTIKGADSHVVSNLLNKIANNHQNPKTPTKVGGSPAKAKVGK
tara:strand:+ start:8072 stop:8248 length:177 start_codon:yes stop_codon:yes gene_type:complete